MTTVLAIVSDTHCGGTTALCPPTYELHNNGTQQANRVQSWLWASWIAYWQRIDDVIATNRAKRLFVVLNGDLVEGDHHNTSQIVSKRPDDMRNIAIACIEPFVRKAHGLWVTKGTEAHVGGGGLWDDVIADDLGAEPAQNSPAHYELDLEVEGVRFAFSHHGRAGQRAWTRGTGARTIAAEMQHLYAARKWSLPRFAVFGHVHRFEESGKINYPINVVTNGCWQLSTAHGHKIRPFLPPDIGGLYFVVDGDAVKDYDKIEAVPEQAKVYANSDTRTGRQRSGTRGPTAGQRGKRRSARLDN
jgi:hypothetical protein